MTIADGIAGLARARAAAPLVRLARLAPPPGGEIVARLDWFAPTGSNRDLHVLAILDEAERSGALPPGGTILEPTSGNIALALAAHAVPRGYRLILVMPGQVPEWRIQLLRAMGADVILTSAARGMAGALEEAERLAAELGPHFRPDQFANPVAARADEGGAEALWIECAGRIDALVVPVATGATLLGLGRALKTLSGGAVHLVAVEPRASPVLSGGAPGRHRIFGMGAPFVPRLWDPELADEIIRIGDRQAHDTLLQLFRREGVMSGPAGAAAVAAALDLAARPEFAGRRIVVPLPDQIERYAGTHYWERFEGRRLIEDIPVER